MNRREFLKAGTIAASATLVGRNPAGATEPRACSPASSPAKPFRETSNLTIRDYLSREARRITDRALTDKTPLAERRRRYMEMMGLQDLPPVGQRPPLNVKVTGVVERPAYRIEKLYYESLPKLYVTANLYVPNKLTGRAPGVLYVCGHSDTQKVNYQAQARRLAELGFVCLIVETVQLGEVRGYHHGCYREGWWHWYSRGYTPAGIELLNGIRGLDLLCERPDVDGAKLGVTGASGGGAATWWIAAGDERIQCAATSCGTSTVASYIHDRTIDGHCDCMWFINTYRWDLADVGGLIAPRAFMISSANRDAIFTIASINEVHDQLKRLYKKLGATDKLALTTYPGPHAYSEYSRTRIFSWFIKHLMGKDVPPEKAGDIELDKTKLESADTLRVFVGGPLKEDRTLTIHEDFFTPPKPPTIADAAALEKERARVIAALREKTIGAFPATPPALGLQVEFELKSGQTSSGNRFAFTSEEGWRLRGRLSITDEIKQPAPAVVALRLPGEERNASENFAGKVRAPWAKIVVEPRGTGDTAWGDELNWHLRRASAWTGRTIASMRVWDALRALQAVRTLREVDPKQVSLAARGEMCVVALYAALLDGNVRTLFLESPPATQNAPGEKDGRGPAIEMLNCLRITDLAQVAGLLFPAEIVIAGATPETYAWAGELYGKLGASKNFHRVKELSAWRASGA
ncbi:MAG: hypothetical protein HZA91_04770 [Verrucomicrobia bacterium]|nr:hypothetical protein [Verrucomicrobiota bacterium]